MHKMQGSFRMPKSAGKKSIYSELIVLKEEVVQCHHNSQPELGQSWL